ncbi:MAG: hypothetical protein AB1489_39015 [Acidobacteriota bacterium]
MKRNKYLVSTLLVALLTLTLPIEKRGREAQAQVSEIIETGLVVGLSLFSQYLSPYDNWVEVDNYGPRWQPANLPAGWQPFRTVRAATAITAAASGL